MRLAYTQVVRLRGFYQRVYSIAGIRYGRAAVSPANVTAIDDQTVAIQALPASTASFRFIS
jgi:hypothetical protein